MQQPRRPTSLRRPGQDYTGLGAYFVTICVRGIARPFGDVREGRLVLTTPGQMIQREWLAIPDHWDGVAVDRFVVMPDHLHGIVLIGDGTGVPRRGGPCGRPSLGAVIGAFKSITTVAYINGVRDHGWPPFARHLWQRGYHDRVIRGGGEWDRIRQYIDDNPARWRADAGPGRSPGDPE